MTKSKIRRILAITLCAAAAVLMIVSGVNMPKKGGPAGQSILEDLRLRAVLSATGSSVVESYVDIAKKEAQQRVKNAGGGMSEIREAVEKAEEEVRARYSNSEVDITGIDTAELTAATEAYAKALNTYDELDSAARAIYIEAHYAEAEAALEAKHQQMLDAGMEIPENDTVEVDMSGFVPTAEMVQAQAEADQAYLAVGAAIQKIYPVLDEESIGTLKTTVKDVVYQVGDTFDTQYDRCIEQSGAKESFAGYLIRHAADILYTAIALVVLAVLLLFNEWLVDKLGIPRVIIGLFFILLCFMTLWCGLSLPSLMSNTIVRTGMNAVMVLAMVPGIQCGISLNLGLPIGLVAGLIGGLLTIELGVPGWGGFALALAVGSVLAAVCGYLYALLLNKLKGEEMSVTTYVGFSVVSLMCIAWLVLPFRSLKLRWPLGTGLRNTIGLDSTNFRHILDDFLSIDIGGFTVPTGLLLFVALCCLIVWLFSRSKTGVAMIAVGNNARFAEAAGLNVNKMRIIGTVLSTVLGAVGILVYSQSYGFMQLYTAPRQMGFIAASAILIGGASTSRCRISHVIIGTFLFQGVLTLGMPVANVLVPGSTISETLRILISNGIILYALTKSGGASRA